jgi:hypothetical protein
MMAMKSKRGSGMRRRTAQALAVAAGVALLVTPALGKKYSYRKVSGQFLFMASNLFDGTLILAKDKLASRLNNVSNAHSQVTKSKFKRGKQQLILEWPDTSSFIGHVIDRETYTGTYENANGSSVTATIARIAMETQVIHHVHFYRAGSQKVKGVVAFNYGQNRGAEKKLYRVAVYLRDAVGNAKLKRNSAGNRVSKLHRLGFFKRRAGQYDSVEAYLVSKDYDPPDTLLPNVILPVDGTNVFGWDWRVNGFKWTDPDDTNAPSVEVDY